VDKYHRTKPREALEGLDRLARLSATSGRRQENVVRCAQCSAFDIAPGCGAGTAKRNPDDLPVWVCIKQKRTRWARAYSTDIREPARQEIA